MNKIAMFLRDELEKSFKNGIPKEEFDTMESLIETSLSGLAIQENEVDVDLYNQAMEEYIQDPSSAISFDDAMEQIINKETVEQLILNSEFEEITQKLSIGAMIQFYNTYREKTGQPNGIVIFGELSQQKIKESILNSIIGEIF